MFVRLFLAQITLAAFSSHHITLGTDQENPTEELQTSQSIEAKQGRICKYVLNLLDLTVQREFCRCVISLLTINSDQS